MKFLHLFAAILLVIVIFIVTIVVLSYSFDRYPSSKLPLFRKDEILTSPVVESVSSRTASLTHEEVVNRIVSTSKPTIEIMKDVPISPKSTDKSPQIALDQIRSLFDMGRKNPSNLIKILKNEDVFGTKYGPENFICPTSEKELVDFPDVTDNGSLQKFQSNDPNTFLFFQHLRKAGGTGFCDYAISNIGRKSVPPYYCMPDDRGSLAIPPWNNDSYLNSYLQNHHFRVVANEWDVFPAKSFLSMTNVVFATTMRNPIDRWYSQYRFEHLEHRDGSAPDAPRRPFITWYRNNRDWMMGRNYYVKTFLGEEISLEETQKINFGDFYWTYHFHRADYSLSWQEFSTALFHFRHFHVIQILDWLNSESNLHFLAEKLQWKKPPHQILPHESQALRSNKTSLRASEILTPSELQFLEQENVMDYLFFEIAKRIVLERFHCASLKA